MLPQEQVITNAKKVGVDKIASIAVAWHEIDAIQEIAEV